MTDIGPGTKVVCVWDGPRLSQRLNWNPKTIPPVLGKSYVVRDVGETVRGEPGLRIEGCFCVVRSKGVEHLDACFHISRFRPVDDTDHSESMELLRKLADTRKVRVDA